MATRYVRSTDGDNASDGSTWALAKADLTGVAAIDTAGDTIWISQAHAESTAGAITFTLAGSAASPQKILCGNDAAEPPTALATTATVTTTGDSSIVTGTSSSYGYYYGISFVAGSAASGTASITAVGGEYDACNFTLGSTGTSSRITIGTAGGQGNLKNCGIKFSATAQSIGNATSCNASIRGGSLLSGGTSPTAMFGPGTRGVFTVKGFDLSNASAGVNICAALADNSTFKILDSKLPTSWSGVLTASAPGTSSIAEMFNCDSGDTNYRYWRETQFGTIRDETTLVATGGASDGTTPISWNMTTNANGEYPICTLDSPEIVRWNDTTGSAITATIEILHDSATNIKDNEIWMEVMYLGTSGVPLGSFISDAVASVVATAADQADSSATWTTTGMANPNTQKLNVSFTPQEKGFIHATIRMAKASTTVYVDPKITVS